jgi:tripartite-type tricarboxylate transporter receptor subunit TctC
MLRLRLPCSLAALVALMVPLLAVAQPYPNKPVRIVLQFPAGGLADTVVRALAIPLADSMKQTIIVDNRPGADGAIAGEAVKNAAPDGYTLLFATNSTLSAVPTLRKKPPYDPVTDFTPIAMTGRFPFFVFAHPSLQPNTLAELVTQAKAHPGKLNYGSGNTTSIMATAQVASIAKLDMVHIPYKGDAPLMLDLVAGRVHFAIASTAPGANLARDGKLKVLGTLASRRNPMFPNAPTMAENGFPSYNLIPWGAMVGPAGMPKDVVDRVAKDVTAAVTDKRVKDILDKFGYELETGGPDFVGKLIREQLAAWKKGVADAGIQPD